MEEFNNDDIIKSKILGKIMKNNKLSITKNKKYKKNNKFYIYHIFDNYKGWSGRWYNTQITSKLLEFDDVKKQVTYIIPEWEKDQNNKITIIKNVPITITFSNLSWIRFYNIFHQKH